MTMGSRAADSVGSSCESVEGITRDIPHLPTGGTVTSSVSYSSVRTMESESIRKLDLVPGQSLGPFTLGMTLLEAKNCLHAAYRFYPRVNLVYDTDADPARDIVLQVTSLGFALRFEPRLQRLCRIDFWPTDDLNITYKGHVIGSSDKQCARFSSIHHLFGPCRGEFFQKRKSYLLQYPGVTFGFILPECQLELYATGEKDLSADGKLVDGSSPFLTSGSVVHGMDWMKAQLPPPSSSESRCAPTYGEIVRAIPGFGLQFETRQQSICFGDTCQDVLAVFGPPEHIYRPDDTVRIGRWQDRPGIFFNYLTLGVDVLFDPNQCRVVSGTTMHFSYRIQFNLDKSQWYIFLELNDINIGIIDWCLFLTLSIVCALCLQVTFVLHANPPGHFDFCSHSKCNFVCEIKCSRAERSTHPTAETTRGTVRIPRVPFGEIVPQCSRVVTSTTEDPNIRSDSTASRWSSTAKSSEKSRKKGKKKTSISKPTMAVPATSWEDGNNKKSSTDGTSDDSAGMDQMNDGTSVHDKSNVLVAALSSSTAVFENGEPGSPPSTNSVLESSAILSISPESRWNDIRRNIRVSEPVVLQHPPTTNCTSPFGATYLWNHGNFIFEVMSNSCIATVTMYSAEP